MQITKNAGDKGKYLDPIYQKVNHGGTTCTVFCKAFDLFAC